MIPLLISLLQGNHVNHPAVEYIQTKKVKVENLSGQDIMVDYDGEYLDDRFPLNIRISKHGISLLVTEQDKEE